MFFDKLSERFLISHVLFQLSGSIALAARGNCTFTQKAREAQGAGATALLVVNNKEGCNLFLQLQLSLTEPFGLETG